MFAEYHLFAIGFANLTIDLLLHRLRDSSFLIDAIVFFSY